MILVDQVLRIMETPVPKPNFIKVGCPRPQRLLEADTTIRSHMKQLNCIGPQTPTFFGWKVDVWPLQARGADVGEALGSVLSIVGKGLWKELLTHVIHYF